MTYYHSRSVGCTVIELLEGKPPYHFLDPMPALFRIVQDDSPPIPEGASPIVKSFLYHCFQKDCNLRISAKKLLRHPWMVAARKQMAGRQGREGDGTKSGGPEKRPLSNYNYDEAVLKVQEWNEALKCSALLIMEVIVDFTQFFLQLRHDPQNNHHPVEQLSRIVMSHRSLLLICYFRHRIHRSLLSSKLLVRAAIYLGNLPLFPPLSVTFVKCCLRPSLYSSLKNRPIIGMMTSKRASPSRSCTVGSIRHRFYVDVAHPGCRF